MLLVTMRSLRLGHHLIKIIKKEPKVPKVEDVKPVSDENSLDFTKLKSPPKFNGLVSNDDNVESSNKGSNMPTFVSEIKTTPVRPKISESEQKMLDFLEGRSEKSLFYNNSVQSLLKMVLKSKFIKSSQQSTIEKIKHYIDAVDSKSNQGLTSPISNLLGEIKTGIENGTISKEGAMAKPNVPLKDDNSGFNSSKPFKYLKNIFHKSNTLSHLFEIQQAMNNGKKYELVDKTVIENIEKKQNQTSSLLSDILKKVESLSNITILQLKTSIPQEDKKERFKERSTSMSHEMDDLMIGIEGSDVSNKNSGLDLDSFIGLIANQSDSNGSFKDILDNLATSFGKYSCDKVGFDEITLRLAQMIYYYSNKLKILQNSTNYDELINSEFGTILKSYVELDKKPLILAQQILFRNELLKFFIQRKSFDLHPSVSKDIAKDLEISNKELASIYEKIESNSLECENEENND